MTEEPVQEEDRYEEKEGKVSPIERIRNSILDIREQFSRGGMFFLFAFFAIGILFGVSAKTIAARSITIGYWDYTVSSQEVSALDLNAIQKKFVAAQKEEEKKQEEEAKKAQEEAEKNLPPLPPAPEPPAIAPQE